jgi:acyl transferase domain-containing protein/acyl carrier protein/SAM-dependent methyltransferase
MKMNSEKAILEIFREVEKKQMTQLEAFAAIEALKHRQSTVGGKVLTRVFKYDETYLKEHVIFGEQVVLGVTNCSLAIEAALAMPSLNRDNQPFPVHIHKFIFHQPLVVSPGEKVEVSIHILEGKGEGGIFFENRFKKFPGSIQGTTTSGQFLTGTDFPLQTVELDRFLHGHGRLIPGEVFRKKRLLHCPPCFRVVEQAYVHGDEVLGEMKLTPEVRNSTYQYHTHPALLNGGFIVAICSQPDNIILENDPGAMWIPFMVKDIYVREALPVNSYCHARVVRANADILVMDFCFCDTDGRVIASLKDFVFRYTKPQQFLREKTRVEVKAADLVVPGPQEVPSQEPGQEPGKITSLQDSIETYIVGKVAEVLGLSEKAINKNKNFMELGIDSNSLIVLAQNIEKELGIELYPTLFFEYQNIAEIVSYFSRDHKEIFSRHFAIISENINKGNGPNPGISESFCGGSRGAVFSKKAPLVAEGKEDIAIIGMAGRFAGSPTVDAFWENLKAGKDLVGEVPPDRWDWRTWFDPDREASNKTYCKWGSFIEIGTFDPLFFGINPREAVWLDPQLRLLLEVTHEAIEAAGYGVKIQGSKTGVFVGVGLREYWDEILRTHIPFVDYQANSSLLFSLSGRISFMYDLHGPSFPVDTACSSSLTSLHLACRALRSGECDMAIASGVNLLISHLHYVYVSRMQALSPTGRCHTFDKSADGYVPGEGVATLLLKPLSRAVRDNDNIQAVIKGSAVNHVGRSNNPTAPRPELQEKVLLDAWEDAGINPETLTYMEAHGTGTKLGDPIEINALKKAFGRFTGQSGFCAVGTAKSHIGHLGASAGAAAVIKTVLSMKHKQIPAMPTFKELNPYIVLEDSPFYINRALQAWEPGPGLPRRAGVSSFGIGGSNAHVVLEEYIAPLQQSTPILSPGVSVASPMLFILSARDEQRLKAYAQKMAGFLETQTPSPFLPDVVYTLQVGRQSMEARLAMVVSTLDETIEKLNQYIQIQNPTEINNLYHGDITTSPVSPGLSKEKEGGEEIRSFIQNRDLHGLARQWVLGADIDWTTLNPGHPGHPGPRLITLPTYPFACERYWIPTGGQGYTKPAPEFSPALHPLLDRQETESLSAQSVVFNKTFEKTEPVVRDHQVQGRCVLPGVGYLEMAAAGFLAIENKDSLSFKPCKFSRVVWQQPLAVSEKGIEVRLILERENSHLVYQVQSREEDRRILHAQGEIHVAPPILHPRISIETVKARCPYHFDKETLYGGFEKIELSYGAYFQGLRQVWAGENEALGQLCVPPGYEAEFSRYTLHPGLVDSALQTIAGLVMKPGNPDFSPGMPFSVEEVEILSPLRTGGYAYVTRTGDQRYDVSVLDEEGNVVVRFHNLAVRKLPHRFKHFFFAPRWKLEPTTPLPDLPFPAGLPVQSMETPEAAGKKKILIIYPTGSTGISKALAASYPHDEVFKIRLGVKNRQWAARHWEINTNDFHALGQCMEQLSQPQILYYLGGLQQGEVDTVDMDALMKSQEDGVFSMFRLLKVLDSRGFLQTPLRLEVITNDVNQVRPSDIIRPFSASLIGFCRAAAKEYPQVKIQCIDISLAEEGPTPDSSPETLGTLIKSMIHVCSSNEKEEIVIREGKCYTRAVEPIEIPMTHQIPFKAHGTYLILGGAGGIGLELSLFLARTVKANLVLVGVDQLTPAQEEKIARIESCGSRVLYIQADATHLESMKAAVEKAKSHFGRIAGVIHSALVLKDSLLTNMEEEDLRVVLAPKVTGSVVLAKALADEPLDFMLFFSSAQSFTCSAGQGNYAAACTFKDAFAHYLDQCKPYPVKIINWGYWGSVGVVATPRYQQQIAAQGAGSIEPGEGMDAVQRILNYPLHQLVCLKAQDHFLEKLGIDLHHYQTLFPLQIPSVLANTVSHLKPPFFELETLQQFQTVYEEMNRCIPGWLLQVFRQMGVFHNGEEHHDRDTLKQQLGIIPKYERLYSAILEILENAGFLRGQDREVVTLTVLDTTAMRPAEQAKDIEEQKDRLKEKFPGIAPHLRLLGTCLTALPDILTGRKHYTEVMFPSGSKELVEGVYQGTPVTDYFNRCAAQVIDAYIRERLQHDPRAVIRILEVGAGTGSTSRFIFNTVAAYEKQIKYCYTDISLGFTQHGRKVYGDDYSFLEFQVLDIEQPIADQGFEPAGIDILLAANVLHATKQMNHTLMNAKKLLKTNGLMVVVEATTGQDLGTLTFGLTEGWWCYEDAHLRLPRTPFLSASQWKNLLEDLGLRQVQVLGLPGYPLKQSPQCVIMGESNGIILEAAREDEKIPQPEQITTAVPGTQTTSPGSLTADKGHSSPGTLSAEQWHEIAIDYIKTVFSGILNIPKARLDQQNTYERYGVDSLVSMEIIRRFEKDLGKLPSTLLFEYMTIEKLSGYILAQHTRQFKEMFISQVEGPLEGTGTPANQNRQKEQAGPNLETLAETPGNSEKGTDTHRFPLTATESTGMVEKPGEPAIAIIGLSGRYPMAETVAEFWQNLQDGKNCIGEIPRDRWNGEEYQERCGSKWGGFIRDADKFDPYFFHISPREAENMDPQERLFLETAWAVFEDAGYTRNRLAGLNHAVGIFVGVMNGDYEFLSGEAYARDQVTGPRSSYSSTANRVSYFFDFQGPSMAIDTACSSSLTALHLACESLKRGECQLAVAGGVNLVFHPVHFQRLKEMKMITGDNQCRPFAEGANGFVDGEGVGAVLLKPLGQAIADRDQVYAVIKGTGVNVGGKTSGYGVPNPNAQTRLISTVLQRANINPRTITYVEAQGTGTALGDSIEINALIKAFQAYTNDTRYCSLGSVKSNIGHLESAGGMASLTKVLLQMKHRELVPSLHARELNPNIAFADSPFYVQQELAQWHPPLIFEKDRENGYPRRAAINSYGAGGANACVILEEPPIRETKSQQIIENPPLGIVGKGNEYLILLSARNEERLKAYAGNILEFLDQDGEQNIPGAVTGKNPHHLLGQKIQQHLVQMAGDILHIQVDEVNPGEELELCGFDVVNQAVLVKRMNDTFNIDIQQEIFSRYPSLASLAGYLCQGYPGILLSYYGMNPVDNKGESKKNLADIAYTLQVGREAMEERVAFVVSTIPELREKITQYCRINGQEDLEHIYSGNIKKTRGKNGPLIDGEEGREYLYRLMDQGKLQKLARLWVSAVEVDLDWSRLYPGLLPRCISLPTYPFARERYWIPLSMVPVGESSRYDRPSGVQPPPAAFTPVSTLLPGKRTGMAANIPGSETAAGEGILRQKIRDILVKGVSTILKINEEYIDLDQDINEFGCDSITFTEFSGWLNERCDLDIMPTIFFEHPNLESLSRYLAQQNRGNFVHPDTYSAGPAVGVSGPDPAMVSRSVEPIAIIGISGVMPGSGDLDVFWHNLASGKDLVTEVPADRWDWREWYGDPAKNAKKTLIKWGGFIDQVDRFDPLFFGISPHEAEMMDPQQRILMETVWHAIEDAGYKASDLSGTIMGLFVGVGGMDYSELVKENAQEFEPYLATGASHAVLVNRISYLLDIHGPSEPVDTACSSSLSAVHRAVGSIRSGECDMAAAGGVNVMINPIWNVVFGKSGMLSPDGKCKTFDRKANGYVRGEGCGIVLLKPLGKAQADNDHIYAVIKSTWLNHGGHATSLTAPNPNAQAELIIKAWEKSGLDPATVTYIETHGTGTELGDPIEINGLKKAFTGLYHQWEKPAPLQPHCGLGSVKTNIGHLETAAGIAGLIKVILAMKYQTLPRHLHLEEVNPYIQLENTPFYIVTETQPWKRLKDKENQEIPLRAGVSAFGFGGVNCHVVLEEYTQPGLNCQPESPSQEPRIIILSAKNEQRLKDYAGKMADFLEKNQSVLSLTEIAYTLQKGREEMEHRLAVVAKDTQELREKWRQFCQGETGIKELYYHRVKPQAAKEKSAAGLTEEKRNREIENLVRQRQWNSLAQSWTNGEKINWQLLYPGQKPNRVSLPTYPFARESYWIRTIPTMRTMQRMHTDSSPAHPPSPVTDLHLLPSLVEPVSQQVDAFLKTDRVQKERKRFLHFHRALAELETFSQWLVLETSREMGFMEKVGERYDKQALRQQLKIIPAYYGLYEEILDILTRAGFISLRGDYITVTLEPRQKKVLKELQRLETRKKRLLKKYPEITPHVRFLSACVDALPRVLTGQSDPLEVLFPRGSMELVEPIYRGNKISDLYNLLAAQVVQIYIRHRIQADPHSRIQILEVGAGTGSTTACVLDAVKPYRKNLGYLYTDISFAFIQQGKKAFADDFPEMEFKVLDIEKDPAAQGIEPHSQDIVLATNVYHATKEINNTLGRTAGLLKPNGILILNEAVQRQNFASLTFGLTNGWWLFQDREHRIKGSPLVSSPTWEKLLEANGFCQVRFFDLKSMIKREPFQEIIIGEYTGETVNRYPTIAPQPIIAAESPAVASAPVPTGKVPLPAEDGSMARQSEQVEETITGVLAQLLDIDKSAFDPELSFQNYGVDSLMAVAIIDRLNEIFNHRLRKTDLFNYSTIRTLGQHIVNDLGMGPGKSPGSKPPQVPQVPQPPVPQPAKMDDERMMKLLCQLEEGELEPEHVADLLEVCSDNAS